MDVFVLAALDRAVRRVGSFSKKFHKDRINPQDGTGIPLGLHYVAHGERPHISTVFEIARIKRVGAYFIENLPAIGPCRERARRSERLRTCDVLVLVVLLAAPNNAVLYYILNRLRHFRLREGDVDDQAFAVLGSILFTSAKGRDPLRQ